MEEIFRELGLAGALGDIMGFLIVFLGLLGALQCFFGYKLFRALTAVVGFFVGGIIGAVVGASAGESWVLLGFVLVGALGAFLAFKLYKLAIFIVCFFGGCLIGVCLAMAMDGGSDMALILAMVLGVLLGIIGVVLVKPVIIIDTSFSGGIILGLVLVSNDPGMSVLIGVVLGVIGVFFQFWMDKKAPASQGAPQGVSAAPAKAAVGGTADSILCACGTQNPAGAAFCKSCGKPLQAPKTEETGGTTDSTLCACGTQNLADAAFCKSCGKPLQ